MIAQGRARAYKLSLRQHALPFIMRGSSSSYSQFSSSSCILPSPSRRRGISVPVANCLYDFRLLRTYVSQHYITPKRDEQVIMFCIVPSFTVSCSPSTESAHTDTYLWVVINSSGPLNATIICLLSNIPEYIYYLYVLWYTNNTREHTWWVIRIRGNTSSL